MDYGDLTGRDAKDEKMRGETLKKNDRRKCSSIRTLLIKVHKF